VLQPHAPAPVLHAEENFREAAQSGLSEAEQVILLHRDARKQAKAPVVEKFIQ
jgi:adenylate cyclase